MDSSETADILAYAFELAGVDRSDIDVTITRDLLCVRGSRPSDGDAPEGTRTSVERMVLLPERLDVDDVAMKYAEGILLVKIAKSDEPSRVKRTIH